MILLFLHLERIRLGPAGYAWFSAKDRLERHPARATIVGVVKQVLWAGIIPLCSQIEVFETFANEARDNIPGEESSSKSRVSSQSLSGSTQLHRRGWGGLWTEGAVKCGEFLYLVRDCRLERISKVEPLEDFTRCSHLFGVVAPFFF